MGAELVIIYNLKNAHDDKLYTNKAHEGEKMMNC